jgi:hypothetical protein
LRHDVELLADFHADLDQRQAIVWAVQVNLQTCIETEHQRWLQSATIIAWTNPASAAPHNSSNVAPLGSLALSAADDEVSGDTNLA